MHTLSDACGAGLLVAVVVHLALLEPISASVALALLALDAAYYRALRWQLWGYAVGTVVAAALYSYGGVGPGRTATRVVAAVLALVSAALVYLLPMTGPHRPSGPHPVGTGLVHVEDERGDRYSFNVRLHFPCRLDAATRSTPYLAYGASVSAGYARFSGLQPLLFSHMALLRVQVAAGGVRDLVPADSNGRLPLVLFSPGLGGTADCYSSLVRDWASHGYLVAVVEHHDESQAYVRLRNGYSRTFRPAKDLKENPEPFARLVEGDDDASLRQARAGQMHHRVDEVRRALEVLVQASEGQPDESLHPEVSLPLLAALRGRIDTARIAVAGHSFGGATATQALSEEPRLAAGINLDGWQLPLDETERETGSRTSPLLLVQGFGFRKWQENYQSMRRTAEAFAAARDTAFFTLRDAGHQNFSDFPMLARFTELLGAAGPTDAGQAIADLNEVSLTFLEAALRRPSADSARTRMQSWLEGQHPRLVPEPSDLAQCTTVAAHLARARKAEEKYQAANSK